MYDSLKVLGLGFGASETKVKVKYRALSQIWHPDKHYSLNTGKTYEETADFFKLINNAQTHLHGIL